MLYFDFKDYEGFKELFGIVEHGNGVKSRKNKILLALYKERERLHYHAMVRHLGDTDKMYDNACRRVDRISNHNCQKNLSRWLDIRNRLDTRYDMLRERLDPEADLIKVTTLPRLKEILYDILRSRYYAKECCDHELMLMRCYYYSNAYRTDEYNGLCEDGTLNAIRYENVEKERTYKMKAGKMFNHLMDCNKVLCGLPEQIKRWLSEEFVAEWINYAKNQIGDEELELHVDDNFEDIYSSSRCAGYDTDCGSFGSCMVNDGQWTFYRDAVDAKAAYLTDDTGKIVARCIVFTNVTDQDGKTWRLAERQYSKFKSPFLQRRLINALIKGGHIDGYKEFGASCGDARKFVNCEGKSIEDRRFRIDCRLEDGDIISYQDSFKWYDPDEETATNYGDGPVDLGTTDRHVSFDNHEDDCWSEYNYEYINPDDAVWVESREDYFYYDQTTDALVYDDRGSFYRERCFDEDCIEVNGDYYYAGHNAECPSEYGIYECPHCEEYFIVNEGVYSELTEEDYCCSDCACEAESEWHRDNGDAWSDYDDEWYDEDDVITAKRWGGYSFYELTISVESFNDLVEDGCATEYMDEFYIDDVNFEGEPVHLYQYRAAV